ncbi:MAG TPA: hypothetical protein VGM43_14535 [Bryobacteraceae bacterium]|jgi:hypothetical protein
MRHTFTDADNRMFEALQITQVKEAVNTEDADIAHVIADARTIHRLTEADIEANYRDAAIHWCSQAKESATENEVLLRKNFDLAQTNAGLKRTIRLQAIYLVVAAVIVCGMGWLVVTR